ncbi:MAG: hypothetical protein IT440_14320 [Phycisphaeraceae bacterium]|nr:hypothetical protein [Phycisphaeraceae bacterium]
MKLISSEPNPPAALAVTSSSQNEPETLSLMGGILRESALQETDELAPPPGFGKSVSQGTLLLLLIVVIAGGTLYAMRQSTRGMWGDVVSTDVEAKVEAALARFAGHPEAGAKVGAWFEDSSVFVRLFDYDVAQRQVPLEQVRKNPFRLVLAAEPARSVRPGDDNQAKTQARAQRKQKLELELKTYNLQTVMRGRIPVAIVSGQFVRQGQSLGSFTVKAIDQMSVRLEADNEEYTLNMNTSGSAKPQGESSSLGGSSGNRRH